MSVSRTATLRRHIREYSEFLGWFIRDLFNHWKMIGFATGSSAAGLFGQLSCFGVIYQYLRKLRANENMVLGPIDFGPANDPQTFMIIVLVAGALLLAAVLLEYIGSVLSFRFGAHYSIVCEKRALLVAGHQNETGGQPLTDDDLKVLTRECRIAGIAARCTTDGLAHIVMLPVGMAILFRIDPGLAGAVAAIALAGGAWYYKMSLQGAEQRSKVQKYSVTARSERLPLIDHALRGIRPLSEDDPELAKAYRDGACARYARASAEQRIVIQKSRFVSNTIIGLSLIAVLLLGGTSAMQGETTWEVLLLFAMSLKVTGNSLVGTMRFFITVNRFYPGLRDYAKAIKSHTLKRTSVSGAPKTVRFQAEDGTSVEATAGTGVAVLAFRSVDRSTAAFLSGAASGANAEAPHIFVLPVPALSSTATLRNAYNLQNHTPESLQSALTPLVGAALAGEAAAAIDLPLGQFEGRGVALSCAIGALMVIQAAPPVAIAPAQALAELRDEERATLSDALARAGISLITIYMDPSQALVSGEQSVLIADGQTLLSVLASESYNPDQKIVRTAQKRYQRYQKSQQGGAFIDDEELL